jgi:hypothetical protein
MFFGKVSTNIMTNDIPPSSKPKSSREPDVLYYPPEFSLDGLPLAAIISLLITGGLVRIFTVSMADDGHAESPE